MPHTKAGTEASNGVMTIRPSQRDQWAIRRIKCVPGDYVIKGAI
jgi:hypothetical protein